MYPNGSQIGNVGRIWAKAETDDFGLISVRKNPRILVQVKARCCKRPAQTTTARSAGGLRNGKTVL